jgi:hypothetical protein
MEANYEDIEIKTYSTNIQNFPLKNWSDIMFKSHRMECEIYHKWECIYCSEWKNWHELFLEKDNSWLRILENWICILKIDNLKHWNQQRK